jgi:hypothetical protein
VPDSVRDLGEHERSDADAKDHRVPTITLF